MRFLFLVALAACSSSSSATSPAPAPAPDDAGSAPVDAAAPVVTVDAGFDAGLPAPTPCPTTGAGAFAVAGTTCLNVTPGALGQTGKNNDRPHYAVRSSTVAPTALVLFLSGSGGNPSGAVQAGAAKNLYAAAVEAGRSALGISYANDDSVGSLCHMDDSCFYPTRRAIVLGSDQSDAGVTVTHDESVVGRATTALAYLAATDPAGHWGDFLVNGALAWPKIIAIGHSQGGGNAAVIGKLFPVLRVVQLSATCDNVDGTAASWTDGTAGTWASDPTMFYGLAAPTTFSGGTPVGGDLTCPWHTRSWTNFGMRGSQRNNAAEICGDTGDTHGESLKCPDNYPTWVSLFR